MLRTPVAVLLSILAAPGPLAAEPATYRLVLDTPAAIVARVSFGGAALVRDQPLSEVRGPDGRRIPSCTVRLRDPGRGRNVVEIAYQAGPDGLLATVERTAAGRTQVVATVRLPPVAGSAPEVREIPFDAPDGLAPAERPTLSAADRGEILAVLQRLHGALQARDRDAVLSLFAPVDAADGRRWVAMLDLLFAVPEYAVEPLQLDGLSWLVLRAGVELRRAEGGPVLRTKDVAAGPQIPGAPPPGRATMRVSPRSVAFRRVDGRWRLALSL